ncbi:hypothetical protein ACER0A_002070 [Haloimpatiens sp. FM7315]|uniref:hypothetical protein n=1 Tax=Haloimpatiens sp. FM7315 TaxID=3298609 RepID=UPI0035A33125
MKQAIMSYITALINVHNNALERITDRATNSNIKTFINELNDLLNFIADSPEEKHITIILNKKDNETLRKRIKELEESCENMCEVERNLHEQIKQLRADNLMWQNACNQLREKLEKLEAIK